MSAAGVTDRWTTRDLPVLRHIVQAFDESNDPDVSDTSVTSALDLSEDEAEAAVRNLERGGYVVIQWMGAGWFVADVTERALRSTGVWPNDERVADQLLWIVEQKAHAASSAEERTRWERLREGLVAAGRDVVVEFAGAMAARTMGV